jgi:capsular polysaccharide export protein
MAHLRADSAQNWLDSVKPLIMLLQGPVGPFFQELQGDFVERGFDVIKVNFNGGDLFFFNNSDVLNFRGSPSDWSVWLSAFIAKRRPAAIVLFGDGRPYHVEALRIAIENHLVSWCLEEGYIRPNYVTCERSGNNAQSLLRQSAAARTRSPITAEASIKSAFWITALYAATYTIAQTFLSAPFQNNIPHRNRPIALECVRWAVNVWRKVVFYRDNRKLLTEIMNGRLRDYYVIALQVHDDLNLLRSGKGWDMERVVDEATRSFAEHAPSGHRLLFKVHPLDRGHRPYRKMVARAARQRGCESRVTVVDDGPIGPMINHSDGLITVNSTSGLIALWQGRPLLVLGDAVYSTPALGTLPPRDSSEMHLFWRRPRIADVTAVSAFLDRMRQESLIGGSFYLAPFRTMTAEAVVNRIQSEFMNERIAKLQAVTGKRHPPMTETDHASLAG